MMNRFSVILKYDSNAWSKWKVHAIDHKTGKMSPPLSCHRPKVDAAAQRLVIQQWLNEVFGANE